MSKKKKLTKKEIMNPESTMIEAVKSKYSIHSDVPLFEETEKVEKQLFKYLKTHGWDDLREKDMGMINLIVGGIDIAHNSGYIKQDSCEILKQRILNIFKVENIINDLKVKSAARIFADPDFQRLRGRLPEKYMMAFMMTKILCEIFLRDGRMTVQDCKGVGKAFIQLVNDYTFKKRNNPLFR